MHSRSTAVLRPPTRPRSFCAQRPRAGSSRLRSAAAMSAEQEVLNANQALLSAIGAGDYNAYASFMDPSVTCFEPEALGQQVRGMDFHKFYFELPAAPAAAPKGPSPVNTMATPIVRMLGADAAVCSYIRLVQKVKDGSPVVVASEESRVWQRLDGKWKNVHFHRSALH